MRPTGIIGLLCTTDKVAPPYCTEDRQQSALALGRAMLHTSPCWEESPVDQQQPSQDQQSHRRPTERQVLWTVGIIVLLALLLRIILAVLTGILAFLVALPSGDFTLAQQQTIASIAESVVTTGAIIAGGFWVYYNYFKARIYKLEPGAANSPG
jgi:hypothetical protein